MAALEITNGDITEIEVGAIICPAHKYLIKGRGLSAQIFDKGGAELEKECKEHKECAVGEARLTSAPNLCTSYIIHTVTPQWTGGDQWGITALEQLRQCYNSVLTLAQENNIRSLVFPALGAGTNKIPHSMAAHVALDGLIKQEDAFDRLIVCLHTESAKREWVDALNKFYAV